jgi:hypothetical protein
LCRRPQGGCHNQDFNDDFHVSASSHGWSDGR